jgi:universal stress protein A
MSLVQRILCPVDFSETSVAAFDYAARLAEEVSAEVVVLHAFDEPATLDMHGQHTPADATLRVRLDAIRRAGDTVPLHHILHAGPAGEVICWVAQDRDCDLIVMGTHGRTGLAHLLFGSTAEYVLRNARCPVLTVRRRPVNEPPLKEPLVLPRRAPRLM